MVFAVPALAQTSSGYPAACEASKVSKGDVDRAHTVFLSGKGFLDEANYDKAIGYFKDAYSIDCSVHAILPIIATAYERKGDKAAAVQALQEYLKRVPSAPDREVIERRIKNLQDQVAHEQAVPTAATAAPSATPAPSGAPTGPAGTAAPATSATAMPSAGEPPPPEARHTLAPWIVVGAGGAALVTGVVLYAVGAGDVSSAENACPKRTACQQSVADQGNTGRTLEAVGVVAGVVGVAAVAGGLVWHFKEPTSSSSAAVSPVVAPGYAGLSLGGHF